MENVQKTAIIDEKKFSPMMRHYLAMKEKYKDCVLFYRLGDFYEMFYDDAIKVSNLLDLTLTGKSCGQEERAPMCGIPFHSADQYVAKLVSLGERVAICEQLSDKANENGVVDREVVKIVTAGTLTEDNQIDEKTNNYVACLYYTNKGCAVSWTDITTGVFYTQNFKQATLLQICDALVRISPSEIISTTEGVKAFNELPIIKQRVLPSLLKYNDRFFMQSNAERELLNHFNSISLSGLALDDKPESMCSSGALLAYLYETQKHSISNVNKITIYKDADYLSLNSSTLNNLEIVKNSKGGEKYGTLLWLMDKTNTAMGSRKLREWLLSPLTDVDKINLRLDAVEEFFNNNMARENLSSLLKSVKDVERLCGKISNGNLNPKDCVSLSVSLDVLPSVKMILATLKSPMLQAVEQKINSFDEITSIIKSAIVENDTPVQIKNGGFVKNGFDEELDKYRSIMTNATNLIEKLENEEKEKTGIKTLKIRYNKVFGYYIEISNSFKNLVPYNYVRKQTLVNGERYVTEELKNLEDEILGSSDKAIELEIAIFNKIKGVLYQNIDKIQKTAKSVAVLDALLSFATVAKNNKYCKPEPLPYGERLELTASRHPVVEKISKNSFVPNDVLMDNDDNRTIIITGPNMAGKSTYMRQIALINILMQAGSFVPCREARIPVVDKIFTRVGAGDNLISDQSTFMVEMSEVAQIIMNATPNSLLILDEVGRGTSTYDGLSIAWAVVEYLNNELKAKLLFSTHYHELSELENVLQGVKNYKITIKELNGQIVFLRKVMRGSANKSFGIEVASLAGIPLSVTKRAKQILNSLTKNDVITEKGVKLVEENEILDEKSESVVIKTLKDTDVNNLTPIQAMKLICELKEICDEQN